MLNNIYVIYDVVRVESGILLQFKNDTMANRFFDKTLDSIENQKENTAQRDDFRMYKLGTIDTETMEIKLMDKPVLMVLDVSEIDEVY